MINWADRQGLEQALNICRECNIDLEEVRAWAASEGNQKKFKEFQIRLTED